MSVGWAGPPTASLRDGTGRADTAGGCDPRHRTLRRDVRGPAGGGGTRLAWTVPLDGAEVPAPG
jgi:hypothetical protein